MTERRATYGAEDPAFLERLQRAMARQIGDTVNELLGEASTANLRDDLLELRQRAWEIADRAEAGDYS